MKEERMYILNLLGEGKVSADEAAKLLEAVGKKSKREYFDEDFNAEEKLKNFSKSAQAFAKDFGGKVEVAFKDMEPKVRKATKVVMEKTASVVDEISKSLHESLNNYNAKCCGDEDAEADDDDTPAEN